ncbi:MAG: branched-chain amino acid ABC transporter permease [Candidatus Accumulibacter sp.]|jgi:branched-chain amino acid transport system permease protein|nr:branched-chain amino acid ABC transporter permease [Accumulibacter sp.]
MTPKQRNTLIVSGMGFALVLPFIVSNPSHQNYLILVLMFAQIGVAWNILGGYVGQVSLGHVAFFGIGAYTSTVLLVSVGLSPWIGMLIGGVVAAFFGLLIGWICFRFKGHYFTMATIAVAEILQVLFTNWEGVGGAVGLYVPLDQQGWWAMVFNSKLPYYYIALGLFAVTLLANWAIEKSFLGYYFRAIKDDPEAARSLGVSLTDYKLVAIAISSFFAALGGSFYAQKELFIDPGSVLVTSLSIKMSLVTILGGIGSLFGPLVGSALLTGIEEATRQILGGSGMGIDLIIYASIIIAVAIYYPTGIIGWVKNIMRRGKKTEGGA